MKDLFISHASEDKDDFVRPLAGLLRQYGLDIWYDEFELKIGSSISRTIDKGIRNSSFGLLVLSHAFFMKNWTEYELKSLNTFEIENPGILLPVWKGVSFNEVRDFSPYLADKFALIVENNIEDIALKIIETVKPTLFSEIHQRIAIQELIKNAEVKYAHPKQFRPGPIRHAKLNENLVSRIRLIRSSLWLCYPHSMDFWMDGFQRDLNVESEIRWWEHISTCFLELAIQHDIAAFHKGTDESTYSNLFTLIFEIAHQQISQQSKTVFDKDFIDTATRVFSNNIPVYDFEEKLPFEDEVN